MFPKKDLPPACPACATAMPSGFGRCPRCLAIRPELRGADRLVTHDIGPCAFTGVETDLRLPDGKRVAADCLLALVDRGWLDAEFEFTQKFYEANPQYLVGGDAASSEEAARYQARCKSRKKIGSTLLVIGVLYAAVAQASLEVSKSGAEKMGALAVPAVFLILACYFYFTKPKR